ncbi:type II secretion system F family protein [Fervidicola ferrireducens]|nr:type II secretion system F family protein [Fervidicola ferrireducens]
MLYFYVSNRKTLKKLISSSYYMDYREETSSKRRTFVQSKANQRNNLKQARTITTLIALIAAVFTAALLLFSNPIIAGLAAAAVLLMMFLGQKVQKLRYSELFNKNLGDALILGANAMRAGASVAQAIENIALNAAYPVNIEFAKVNKAIKLGMPVSEALAIIKEDVNSREAEVLITAVNILLYTGGNMAEVFENISRVIKERVVFKSTVRAMTAQTRLSAAVISAMPFFIVGAVNYISPEYFTPLIELYGRKVFAFAFGMVGVGWLFIRKLMNIDTD